MDERAIKRLLVIVAVSILAIMLFKWMMSRTIVNLGKAAAEKKQSLIASPVPQQENANLPGTAMNVETTAASASTEATALETSPASGVSDVR